MIGDLITVFTVVVMACCGRALGKVEMMRVEEGVRGAAIAQSVVREWPSADRLQMRDTKRKKSACMGIEPSASAHEKYTH